MIVDSSALMAILMDEPESEQMIRALSGAANPKMSSGNWIELAAVLTRRKRPDLFAPLELLMAMFRISLAPATTAQAAIGHRGYREFGQGSGHRAKLNFGDCFAYALAWSSGEPLLFKGDDFVHTDVKQALPR